MQKVQAKYGEVTGTADGMSDSKCVHLSRDQLPAAFRTWIIFIRVTEVIKLLQSCINKI